MGSLQWSSCRNERSFTHEKNKHLSEPKSRVTSSFWGGRQQQKSDVRSDGLCQKWSFGDVFKRTRWYCAKTVFGEKHARRHRLYWWSSHAFLPSAWYTKEARFLWWWRCQFICQKFCQHAALQRLCGCQCQCAWRQKAAWQCAGQHRPNRFDGHCQPAVKLSGELLCSPMGHLW